MHSYGLSLIVFLFLSISQLKYTEENYIYNSHPHVFQCAYVVSSTKLHLVQEGIEC
jgi:hypothetical protein